MIRDLRSLQSAALTDVVFLVGFTPSSLAPISIAEMHLYAYLANLISLNRGMPVADWGYGFSVTTEGFPFAHDLEQARQNLIGRSIIRENDSGLWPERELLEAEVAVLESLRQSERRKEWLTDAFACALNLPQGAVRDAINRSPGVALSLRLRRAASLLKDTDVEEIYEEFELIKKVLGPESEDMLQPVVVWLSGRVITGL